MIFYENEIKRMNMWEKVVQVSSEVGFVAPSVEQAKIEIAKGMAKFGLVLFQSSEGLQKLVDVHNTNEYVEIASETREKALLELFNVTIMRETVKAVEPKQDVKLNVVNTPQEAVAKANEVKGFVPNAKFDAIEYVNDIHKQLHQEIGTALKYAQLNGRVSSKRLGPIFRKIAVIGWDKEQFKKAINSLLGVNDFEREMSNDQCTVLINHLIELEEKAKDGLDENTKRHLDGFSDDFVREEIV